jgi:hypothetical protein
MILPDKSVSPNSVKSVASFSRRFQVETFIETARARCVLAAPAAARAARGGRSQQPAHTVRGGLLGPASRKLKLCIDPASAATITRVLAYSARTPPPRLQCLP